MARYVSGLIEGLAAEQIATTAFVADRVEARTLQRAHPALDVDVLRPGSLARHIDDRPWYLATGLFLSPTSFDPVPRIVTESRLPVAGVMFDVIPFRHPERYQNDEAVRRRLRLRASLTRSLDAVLAISEFSSTTAIDELRLDRARVATIGTGVSARFVPPRAPEREDWRRRRHGRRRTEEHPSSDRRVGETSGRSPPTSPAVRGGRGSSERARAVAGVGSRRGV